MQKIDIRLGDSLLGMRSMGDGSVDLIVTSPPYADARKSTYGGVAPDKYVEWFLPFAAEMKRILSDDGSFILNIKEKVVNGERHTYVYELVIALRKMGWLWTEEYMWHKTTTTPGKWPNRFRDQWEHVYHFTKSKKFKMNQEAVMVPVGDWAKTRMKNLSQNDMTRSNSATMSGYGRDMSKWLGRDVVFPSNVLQASAEAGNKKHSAVYPVWLPEWFIKLFSDAGDTVLDPFIGSGTTAVAAINLNRACVGFEVVPEYYKVAQERVAEIGG